MKAFDILPEILVLLAYKKNTQSAISSLTVRGLVVLKDGNHHLISLQRKSCLYTESVTYLRSNLHSIPGDKCPMRDSQIE